MNNARNSQTSVTATQPTPIPAWLEGFRQRLGDNAGEPVELIETHISWLLLVNGFAYKLKKPIRLPFLDYGCLLYTSPSPRD